MKQNYPLSQYLPSTPPGATLADLLLERALSHADFCRQTKLSHTRLCRIISGEESMTTDLAELFESSLGPPASFWMNREKLFRQALRATSSCADLSAEVLAHPVQSSASQQMDKQASIQR
jgi:plasmid maintenance system antidote protein VapI